MAAVSQEVANLINDNVLDAYKEFKKLLGNLKDSTNKGNEEYLQALISSIIALREALAHNQFTDDNDQDTKLKKLIFDKITDDLVFFVDLLKHELQSIKPESDKLKALLMSGYLMTIISNIITPIDLFINSDHQLELKDFYNGVVPNKKGETIESLKLAIKSYQDLNKTFLGEIKTEIEKVPYEWGDIILKRLQGKTFTSGYQFGDFTKALITGVREYYLPKDATEKQIKQYINKYFVNISASISVLGIPYGLASVAYSQLQIAALASAKKLGANFLADQFYTELYDFNNKFINLAVELNNGNINKVELTARLDELYKSLIGIKTVAMKDVTEKESSKRSLADLNQFKGIYDLEYFIKRLKDKVDKGQFVININDFETNFLLTNIVNLSNILRAGGVPMALRYLPEGSIAKEKDLAPEKGIVGNVVDVLQVLANGLPAAQLVNYLYSGQYDQVMTTMYNMLPENGFAGLLSAQEEDNGPSSSVCYENSPNRNVLNKYNKK